MESQNDVDPLCVLGRYRGGFQMLMIHLFNRRNKHDDSNGGYGRIKILFTLLSAPFLVSQQKDNFSTYRKYAYQQQSRYLKPTTEAETRTEESREWIKMKRVAHAVSVDEDACACVVRPCVIGKEIGEIEVDI
ncbi:hypothetical protein OUZ56_006012 [Daphnia magna]|uniref:Uncharacterized protein n=1 Tax=Daphnia magna TaxID=35525 RepID=A0ABQ9YUF8_9CRUS|nr:hypothetical protein OUZ56_006012 [Daphnia magna]